MSSISVKNLSYTYAENTPLAHAALKEVSFEVNAGEFIGVIGHTGSGKSTLVQHLNALIRPTSGDVLLDGVSVYKDAKRMREVRHKVGLVFQYPEHQLFEETVYKDIAYGPSNMGMSESEIECAVGEAADFVGLERELMQKSPFELSGGQKRRAAIAGVIAMRPQVLILDEPTAGLDPAGRDDILSHVRDYHKKTGGITFLISHSMEDIADIADRVMVLSSGRLEMFDTVSRVFANEKRLREIGLKLPQVTNICEILRRNGIDLGPDCFTVDTVFERIVERKRRRAR